MGDFRGKKRKNGTHESKTDPESKLYRKGNGHEAKLSYMAHALMENRNGLLVDFDVTEASGYAERHAAIRMQNRAVRPLRRDSIQSAENLEVTNRGGSHLTVQDGRGPFFTGLVCRPGW